MKMVLYYPQMFFAWYSKGFKNRLALYKNLETKSDENLPKFAKIGHFFRTNRYFLSNQVLEKHEKVADTM